MAIQCPVVIFSNNSVMAVIRESIAIEDYDVCTLINIALDIFDGSIVVP